MGMGIGGGWCNIVLCMRCVERAHRAPTRGDIIQRILRYVDHENEEHPTEEHHPSNKIVPCETKATVSTSCPTIIPLLINSFLLYEREYSFRACA